jgi:hypothetical protein
MRALDATRSSTVVNGSESITCGPCREPDSRNADRLKAMAQLISRKGATTSRLSVMRQLRPRQYRDILSGLGAAAAGRRVQERQESRESIAMRFLKAARAKPCAFLAVLDLRVGLAHVEDGHDLRKAMRLVAHRHRRRCGFLDERGIPLRHPVQIRDGLIDLHLLCRCVTESSAS